MVIIYTSCINIKLLWTCCVLVIKAQRQKLVQQQAIVQQSITQQAIQTAPWQQNTQQQQHIQQLKEQVEAQRKVTLEQIKQSEQNLAAQYQSLIQQQQVDISRINWQIPVEYTFSLSTFYPEIWEMWSKCSMKKVKWPVKEKKFFMKWCHMVWNIVSRRKCCMEICQLNKTKQRWQLCAADIYMTHGYPINIEIYSITLHIPVKD